MRQAAKLTVPLLAVLMVFGSMASAGAQVLSDEELTASLEGLETLYIRSAVLDFNAMTEGGSTGNWVAVVAGVAAFDSEEHAAAAVALISENGAVPMMAAQNGTEPEAVELDLDFEHVASQASSEDDGVTYTILQSVAQEGELVYIAYGWVMDHDPAEKVTSTLEAMYGAEPADDPETFNDDGTSTGGLWGLLPTVEDLTVGTVGLADIEDSIEFPVQDGAGS